MANEVSFHLVEGTQFHCYVCNDDDMAPRFVAHRNRLGEEIHHLHDKCLRTYLSIRGDYRCPECKGAIIGVPEEMVRALVPPKKPFLSHLFSALVPSVILGTTLSTVVGIASKVADQYRTIDHRDLITGQIIREPYRGDQTLFSWTFLLTLGGGVTTLSTLMHLIHRRC